MKYCTHCGAEMLDEAVLCVKCGCAVDDKYVVVKQKKEEKKPRSKPTVLEIIAFVLMIVEAASTVFIPLFSIPFFTGTILTIKFNGVEIDDATVIFVFTVIILILTIVRLAYVIPMTIVYRRKTLKLQDVSVAFKVCTLIFVNLVAGILMLCDKPKPVEPERSEQPEQPQQPTQSE